MVAFLFFVVLGLIGFLAGSIPFGIIIGKVFFSVDIRKHGSGNIGAANAMRTIGKGGAAAVLLLDALKGYIPVALTFRFLPLPQALWPIIASFFYLAFRQEQALNAAEIARSATFTEISHFYSHDYIAILFALPVAIGAILGHCFTPWLGFRGGKGVATALGATLALSWQAGLAGIIVYALVARLTRISAIGSLSGVAVGAIVLGMRLGSPGWIYGAFSFALILYTHRSNLVRLRAGRELTL